MPACANATAPTLPPVAAGLFGPKPRTWPFASTGGTLLLRGADMPAQPEAWAAIQRIRLACAGFAPYLQTTHVRARAHICLARVLCGAACLCVAAGGLLPAGCGRCRRTHPTPLPLPPTHTSRPPPPRSAQICSYLCYFSRWSGEVYNSCLLRNTNNTALLATNSYCVTPPNTGPVPNWP